MIRINLMPRDEARRQAARSRDTQIAIALLALLGGGLLVSEIVSRREIGQVEAQAEENQRELAELSRRQKEAQLFEKRRHEVRRKLDTIEVLERQKTGPARVLEQISMATPDKLWLIEINEAGGSLTFNGKGLDNQTIAAFMRSLEASPYFDGVDLVETKQVEEGQAKLKQFSVRANVLYGGRPQPAAPTASGAEPTGGAAPAGTQPAGADAPVAAGPDTGRAPPPPPPPPPAAPAAQPAPVRPANVAPNSGSQAPAAPVATGSGLSPSNPLAGTIGAKRAAEEGVRKAQEQAAQQAQDAAGSLGSAGSPSGVVGGRP